MGKKKKVQEGKDKQKGRHWTYNVSEDNDQLRQDQHEYNRK